MAITLSEFPIKNASFLLDMVTKYYNNDDQRHLFVLKIKFSAFQTFF